MQSIHLDYQGTDLTFSKASALAKTLARENRMQDPAIISWHQRSSDAMLPSYAGADPGSWWEKYGEGNGGRLEISVGEEYEFVMMETRGYETVDQLPIRNLADSQGQEYVCFTSMLGESGKPDQKACMPLDEWMANQY